jgi:hypothetical protein
VRRLPTVPVGRETGAAVRLERRAMQRARAGVRRVGVAGVLYALAATVTATAVAAAAITAGGSPSGATLSQSVPLTLPSDSTTWSVQAKEPGRVTIVPSPGRPGESALRLNVKPGDTEVAGSGADAERTDVMIPSTVTDAREGREQWWSWSTYFPADYQPTPSTAWNIFLDFHHTGESGQANINLLADTHFDPPVMELTAYGAHTDQATFKLGPVLRGRWYDFSLHVVWSAKPRVGLLELYLNGRRVIRPQHRATLYAGEGAYLKLANYRQAGGGDSAILMARVRRTRSYAAAVEGFAPYSAWARRISSRGDSH